MARWLSLPPHKKNSGSNMSSRENTGMALGLLGVVIFSLTLPMTRIVVQEVHPLLNGLGRALVAAIPAAALLLWRREKWPTWAQFRALCLVILGVIIGFPVLSAWAMKSLPASHGALVNGLQPLLVAIYAAWLSHERPSKAFWGCAALGSALVLAYALISGAGNIQAGDLWMLAAVAVGGLGYAEGGRLAKQMGGWQVICWALVLSVPLLLGPSSIWACNTKARFPPAPGGHSVMWRSSRSSSVSSPGTRGWRWAASPGSARFNCCRFSSPSLFLRCSLVSTSSRSPGCSPASRSI